MLLDQSDQRRPGPVGSQQRLPFEEEGGEDDHCDNDLDREGALDELANEVEQRKVEQ